MDEQSIWAGQYVEESTSSGSGDSEHDRNYQTLLTHFWSSTLLETETEPEPEQDSQTQPRTRTARERKGTKKTPIPMYTPRSLICQNDFWPRPIKLLESEKDDSQAKGLRGCGTPFAGSW